MNRCKEWINDLSESRFEKVIWYQELKEKGVNQTVYDDYRFQLTIFKNNSSYFQEVIQQVQRKLDTIQKHLQIVFMIVLLSKPNGPTQREHQDYPNLDFPVFSIIVSFDNRST